MKRKIIFQSGAVLVGMAMLAGVLRASAGQAEATTSAPRVASESAPTVQLSFGEQEVLKLVRAKVGDELVVAYVEKSPANYDLNAAEIVYLREQGVSDSILTAMLKQRKKANEAAAQNAPAPAPAAPTTATIAAAPAAPATTYVGAMPAYVPAAPVYVSPPSPTYVYYDSYPRYAGYYGWYVPPVSLSFGFGRGFHAGYHGGFQGGYWGGHHGGFHGNRVSVGVGFRHR